MREVGLIIEVLIAVVIVAVFIQYQRLVKRRYMAVMYMQRLEEPIVNWFDMAGGVFHIVGGKEHIQERYTSLVRAIQEIKPHKADRMVPLANEAFEMIRELLIDSYKQPEGENLCSELEDQYKQFNYMAEQYNRYAGEQNIILEKPFGRIVGKVFRTKSLQKLSEFSIL
jgi:hypothetical protein